MRTARRGWIRVDCATRLIALSLLASSLAACGSEDDLRTADAAWHDVALLLDAAGGLDADDTGAAGADAAGRPEDGQGASDAATQDDANGGDAGLVDAASEDTADAGGAEDATTGDDAGTDVSTDASSDSAASADSDGAVASDGGPADSQVEDAADAGPIAPPPILVIPGPPVKASIEVLDPGSWSAAVPTTGDEVLAYRAGKEGPEWRTLGPLAGQVTAHKGPAAVPVAGLAVGAARLVRHAAGIVGLVGKNWLPSPVADALPGPVQTWRVVEQGKALAIVAAGELWLWRAGKLGKVPLDAPVQGAASLAWGCVGPKGPSLWIGDSKGLRSIAVAADYSATIHTWVDDRAFTGVVCDAAGLLWTTGDGELAVRGPGGIFVTYALGTAVDAVFGIDGSSGHWLAVGDTIWRVDGDVFRQVTGISATQAWQVDAKGRLISVGAAGIRRASTQPPPPTPKVKWSESVKPIYEASCALCHGAAGVTTKLDSAKKWQDKFPTILYVVESGAMPLPPKQPLDSAAIATLKAWQKDGFLP